MTRIEMARKGIVTEEFEEVSLNEGIPVGQLIEDIASGRSVITRNTRHNIRPVGIGRYLSMVRLKSSMPLSDMVPMLLWTSQQEGLLRR
jgi:thiamine biosynthesis protein ThiC